MSQQFPQAAPLAPLLPADRQRDAAELLERRAAAPLKPARPQEFDLSPLPLFGDQAKQGDLFT